jgi:hypothetical protein
MMVMTGLQSLYLIDSLTIRLSLRNLSRKIRSSSYNLPHELKGISASFYNNTKCGSYILPHELKGISLFFQKVHSLISS